MKINELVDGKIIEREMATEEEASLAIFTPTAEEQIELLKAQLADTDYKAIKYAEGWISEEDYAPIKSGRQAIRVQINELEKQI